MSSINPTEEYNKILNALRENEISKDEAYAHLVKKEDNVLKTLNRIAENEQRQTEKITLFYHLPLLTIVALFVNTWKNIFDEIVVYKQYKTFREFADVFIKEDRKIYVGLMFVWIGIFSLLVHVL